MPTMIIPHSIRKQALAVLLSVGVASIPIQSAWAANSSIITTVAGGESGSNYAATSIAIGAGLFGMAVDRNGNLYLSDYSNHRIRKVGNDGIITTVAGNGSPGFSGDNGSALAAQLDHPTGLAVDANGNLFVADSSNHCIRKVASDGIITTVAGNGSYGFSGDNGSATSAQFSDLNDVAVDTSGNLFIADTNNERIRKVGSNGIVTTVAGTGVRGFSGDSGNATSAQLFFPQGVSVDTNGNVFIADTYNHRIRKVDNSGTITTVAGSGSGGGFSGDNGSATLAELNSPQGVSVDSSGNLFIADLNNCRIRKVDSNGIITTVAGNGVRGFSGDNGNAQSAELEFPENVIVDQNGNLFIADSSNYRIRKVETNGIIATVAGNGFMGFSGDNGPATSAQICIPGGVALDSAGNLFIADFGSQRVRKVGTNGIITTVAGNGSPGFSGDNGAATLAELNYPNRLAVDDRGNLFIADSGNNRVRKVDSQGIITTVAGNGSSGFSGDNGSATLASISAWDVALDSAGNLFIVDSSNERIRKVGSNGIITTVAGNGSFQFFGDNGSAVNAQLNPRGLAVDANGNLFIADSLNNRIRKVDNHGIITTVAGTGSAGFSGDNGSAINAQLSGPAAISVDGNGNLLVADLFNGLIRKIDGNGIITTVAGTGVLGFAGDNGSATNALLNYPAGLAIDESGSLFIADHENNRIRKVLNTAIVPPTPTPISSANGRNLIAAKNDCVSPWDANGNAPVKIYNHGGNKVWEKSPSQCWDGRLNGDGDEVAPGVYVWIQSGNRGKILKQR